MEQYVLPELSYDYAALEPHISGKIMELHHDKHHAAYVKGANAALEMLEGARKTEDFARITAFERSLAFNLSGHLLHSLFWQNLAPRAGGPPRGDFADTIDRDFGGFGSFKRQMTAAASSIMGSGWAALVWEPVGGRLLITQIYDHQSNLIQAGLPLLVIDAWEHAFYLQYQNRKDEYLEAVWQVCNWEDVTRRFDAVRQVDVSLVGAAR